VFLFTVDRHSAEMQNREAVMTGRAVAAQSIPLSGLQFGMHREFNLLAAIISGASVRCIRFIKRWRSVACLLKREEQSRRDVRGDRKLLCAALIIVCLAVTLPASVFAAQFPWRSATLSYNAKSTALVRVLEDIFVTQLYPVQISDAVKSLPSINGNFDLPPKAFFGHLSSAYGLVSYFDGSTMFVTTLAENQTVLQSLSKISAQEVERTAKEFGYADIRFVFRKVNSPPALQLSGPPAYVERIGDVISILEAGAVERLQDTRMAFRVVPLKHAWAEDVTYSVGGRDVLISGVASSLRKLVDGIGELDGFEPRETGLASPAKPANTERRPASLLENFFPGKSSSDQANKKNGVAERTVAEVERAEHTNRSARSRGQSARIVGDSRMNAIVMMAPVEMLAMLEDVVRELDVEPELIQIEATVMDVQGGVLKELGFDLSLNANNRFGFESNTAGNGAGVAGNGPNISIFGGSVATNFLSRITAMQTTGKTNILSRPKLATLNGIEAILSNQNVFYPKVEGERFGQLYQVDVGLTMRVVPIVVRRSSGKPDIRLRIFIEDGSISNRLAGGLPIVSRSSISTQAIVQDGSSLLIGGYVKDTDENSEAKVPVLGDIPGLGALFRYRMNNADRRERLFLITPKLLRGAEIGAESPSISETGDADSAVPPNPIDETGPAAESAPRMDVDTAQQRRPAVFWDRENS